MNSQGALGNHEKDCAYQLLKAVIRARKKWFGYDELSDKVTLQYANFNRRAKRLVVQRLAGFALYKKEGANSFIKFDTDAWVGKSAAEVLKAHRIARGWEVAA